MNIEKLKEAYYEKSNKVFLLPLGIRRLILISIDAITIVISICTSSLITNSEEFIINTNYLSKLIILGLFSGIPIYIFTGQYKSLTGYFREKLIYKFVLRNFLNILTLTVLIKAIAFNLPPTNFLIVFFLINTNLSIWLRLIMKDLIISSNKKRKESQPNVVIYGAGMAGAQLASSLELSGAYKIEAFIDDNPSLWGRTLNSKKIISRKQLDKIKKRINLILIAIPSLKNSRKQTLIKSLNKYLIPILEIPSIEELALGKAKINTLRPIQIEDLLGRDQIIQKSESIGKKIKDSNILITGGGGSIGSELCRQIMIYKPEQLIILENNELALYSIEAELKELYSNNEKIISILGNATNESLIFEILKENNINIIFHAAAYKHVPIVEANPIEGLLNNVISSFVICKASKFHKVKDVVLISSDKAVRPTNIMGASKRLSELIFKSFSIQSQDTLYSMVRFGNVLGSSGSVVPLFRKQIEKGGPIKVTHPEIIRYFMTINEACGLVLQTIELAKGGDIFLLDMGEPVKIIDLAKQMISLSGLKLKDSNNPDGDIEIISTGLRPGEKLFEELLVDGEARPTINPLIFRDKETLKINKDFPKQIEKLIDLLVKRDFEQSIKLVNELIPEWTNSNLLRK